MISSAHYRKLDLAGILGRQPLHRAPSVGAVCPRAWAIAPKSLAATLLRPCVVRTDFCGLGEV